MVRQITLSSKLKTNIVTCPVTSITTESLSMS